MLIYTKLYIFIFLNSFFLYINIQKTKVIRPKNNSNYKFIDLFAGIGGFHYALKKLDKYAKPVLVSEIDKYAKAQYINNHKYKGEIKNIKDVIASEVEDHDIAFGGFPCQTFSNAGKKLGFEDETKGTLFFDIVRLLKTKKTKYILLENVKHLISHDEERTWITIRETLRKIGYKVPQQPIVLSPHQFGIPQIRWRVFIPGILSKNISNEEMEFDFSTKYKKPKKLILDKNIDPTTWVRDQKILMAIEGWTEFVSKVKRIEGRTLPVIWLDHMNDFKVNYKGMPKWKQKYIKDMKKIYLMNKKFIDQWMKKYEVNKWSKRERKLEWQAGKDNFETKNAFLQLRQSGMRFKKADIFPTLVAMVQTSLVFDKAKWRYLSLNEVRKLQSFPNSFKPSVNPHQTYKQFGNSVNVEVVRIVLERLLNMEVKND